MSKQLKQVINLSKKTGDRVIVFDNSCPDESFILMTLDQYESLLVKAEKTVEEETPKEHLTEKEQESLTDEPAKDFLEKEEVAVSQRENTAAVEIAKNSFEEEVEKRDAEISRNNEVNTKKQIFEEIPIIEAKKEVIIDGPLKETLRNLLTEKKIVDKIDSIEKNNANLNGNRLNNWRIPPEIKEDSE